MATNKQKEELMEILKFTPCTYKITMWGYGGEYVMGTVDRAIYDYFKHRRLDLSDFAWDSDYADHNNIPEEMWPFPPGSWYECDDMGHVHGVDRNSGTLQIEDEQGNTIVERSLETIDGCDIELSCNDEVWIDSKDPGTVVFIGSSGEKGTFFEGEINLKSPFNQEKLLICYDEFDGNEVVSSIEYDGEEIENWGANTNGKSSDFGFYIAGSQQGGKWQRYKNMDDIQYPMTEWFPKKIKPAYEGLYEIRSASSKNSYHQQAKWTGSRWISSWSEDLPEIEELKVNDWRGISVDPDTYSEWDPVVELDKIIAESADIAEEELVRALDELKQEFEAPLDTKSKGTWPF
jgi:hypothetical protein